MFDFAFRSNWPIFAENNNDMANRRIMLIRVSESTKESVKALSDDLGISEGEVIDFLVNGYLSSSEDSARKRVEDQ